MGDPNRMWTAQLRADQNKALQQMVEEQDLNKSEALKRCVDTHIEHESGASLTNYEDAALDGAVFSAISTIAVATSTLIGLLPFMEGLLLASVLAATAVVFVLIVQQGLLGGER